MDTRQLLLDRRALVADLRSPCTPLERATIEAQIRMIDRQLATTRSKPVTP